jgi:hypothetical protein
MQMKHDPTTLPENMRHLPVDERGYIVPFFVAWMGGKPEFRAMDPEKWLRCVKRNLCWVCGGRLGARITFVIGPMCGINRTTSEPAGHLECARWSAKNCPFLARPHMVRREDELSDALKENVAGYQIDRNPGVMALWTTRTFKIFNDGQGKPLIQIGEPESIEWYAEGRPATRAEIEESVRTGLPNLEALARLEKGGMAFLEKQKHRFEVLLPA